MRNQQVPEAITIEACEEFEVLLVLLDHPGALFA
jgi:hypothetical protein